MYRSVLAFLGILLVLFTSSKEVRAAVSWPSVSSKAYCEFTAEKDIKVYRDAACKTRGTCSPEKSYNASISKKDVCYVYKFTNSYLQVNYPTSSGRRTGYIKRSDFVTDSGISAPTKLSKSTRKVTTYKSPGGATYGNTASGDSIYALGQKSGYTAIIYTAKSGNRAFKYGYVKTADYYKIIPAPAPAPTPAPTPTPTPTPAPAPVVQPTGVSLNRGNFTLTKVGQTCTLSATVSPSNAANKSVSWSSSNTSVAAVNKSGTVTAKNNGTAKITAKTSNGKTASVTVTVKLPFKKYGANLSKVPSYKQNGGDWKNTPYGYKDKAKTKKATIGSSGCGLLAVTNAVYYLNGKFIDPKTLASYSLKNNYRENGVGTKHSFTKAFITDKGGKYNVKYAGTVSGYSELRDGMNKGYVAVCSKPGHFMSIVDYDPSSKKFLLLDSSPNSSRGTSKGYAWKTESQLKSIGLRTTFYLIKNK